MIVYLPFVYVLFSNEEKYRTLFTSKQCHSSFYNIGTHNALLPSLEAKILFFIMKRPSKITNDALHDRKNTIVYLLTVNIKLPIDVLST